MVVAFQDTERKAGAMIEIKCSQCGAKMAAPPNLAGKKGKCPRCGELFRVPTGTMAATPAKQAPPAGRRTEQDQEMLDQVTADVLGLQMQEPVMADEQRELNQAAAQAEGKTLCDRCHLPMPIESGNWNDNAFLCARCAGQKSKRTQRRSLASFIWGWGLIAGGLIAWFVSCAVVSYTPAHETNLSGWRRVAVENEENQRRFVNSYLYGAEKGEAMYRKDKADIETRISEEIAQIQLIKGITLAIRIVAVGCALAGAILVSFWLGTGGTRPRGVQSD
jgi:hypothetical protein